MKYSRIEFRIYTKPDGKSVNVCICDVSFDLSSVSFSYKLSTVSKSDVVGCALIDSFVSNNSPTKCHKFVLIEKKSQFKLY